MTTHRFLALAVGLVLLASFPAAGGAQIAVSGNDNKVVNVNGVTTVVMNPPPDAPSPWSGASPAGRPATTTA